MNDGQTVNYRRKYAAEAQALQRIHPLRSLWLIARQWLAIAAALALPFIVLELQGGVDALSAAGWAAVAACFALSFFLVACKQHALGIIMHDATHYRLFSNRRLNELASNWLCAFPAGMVTSCYRRGHLPHHVFTNRPNDPYWARLVEDPAYRFPQSRQSFRRLLLRDLFCLNFAAWRPILRYWTGWGAVIDNREKLLTGSERLQFAAFWLIVAAAAIASGAWPWLIVLWLLPLHTLCLAFMRVRIVAEHNLDDSGPELSHTRHVDASWLERLTLAPLNINYHIAHHLFPSVPLHNLPRLHALLLRDPAFRAQAMLWPRYFGKNDKGLMNSLLR